jgi:hypothetical protein
MKEILISLTLTQLAYIITTAHQKVKGTVKIPASCRAVELLQAVIFNSQERNFPQSSQPYTEKSLIRSCNNTTILGTIMLVHSAHTHTHTHTQFLAPNFVRVTAFQIVCSPAPLILL